MSENNDWKKEALGLATNTDMSWRKIAREVGVAKSTCSDYLRSCFPKKKSAEGFKLNGDVKILCYDLETFPILGAVWKLFDNNVGINQIERDWSLLSYAAKWVGTDMTLDNVIYNDVRHRSDINDDSELVAELWDLMNEADIVLTKNGNAFDIKKLNARFVQLGFPPPSSFKSIDLDQICKRHFKFTSRKLEYLSQELNEQFKKLSHSKFAGYAMWEQCLKGNIEAFEECKEYNKYDVLSTEELYYTLSPWSNSLPSFHTYSESESWKCNCGNTEVKSVGFTHTGSAKYEKFQCTSCGKNLRGKLNLLTKEKRSNTLMNVTN